MVCAGMSFGGHTDVHVLRGETLRGVWHIDEIPHPYVQCMLLVTNSFWSGFWANDINSSTCRSKSIEYLWDYLGWQFAALNPPPKSLDELEQDLLGVWSSHLISMLDNLIDIIHLVIIPFQHFSNDACFHRARPSFGLL